MNHTLALPSWLLTDGAEGLPQGCPGQTIRAATSAQDTDLWRTATDADLLKASRHGDNREAFGELVRRHQAEVRAWLRRMTHGDHALADDLAQETFLRAHQKLSSFRGHARFSTWLIGIAYNQLRSSRRRARVHVGLDDPAARAVPASDNLEAATADRLDFDTALQRLSDDQRTAILLCYQQGFTHEEAAEILQCPVGTVKTHILRGKERLRRWLGVTATSD